MTESLTVDDLQFEVRRSPRRKTVGLIVERDGRLVAAAPSDCPLEDIERVARGKLVWVYEKLGRKAELPPPVVTREYVSGEGFYHLGRSYRLLLVDEDAPVPALRLRQGWFMLKRLERARGREHFVTWYTRHALPWIERRMRVLAERIGATPRAVHVRDLGFRWGSATRRGDLNFHWRAIMLPPLMIEYVIAHELVHLHESRHGPEFWARVERVIPDYRDRRDWLAEHGRQFDL